MFGYILPLFHWQFWFNTQAIPFVAWAQTLILSGLIFLTFVAVMTLVMLNFPRQRLLAWGWNVQVVQRSMLRQLAVWAILAAVVGWCLYGVNSQWIPYLSMRIFWFVWFVVSIVWFGWLVWALRRDLARMMSEQERQQQRTAYEKWLPKPKHR